MAPQIRFVRGPRARVACSVDGSGPLLVLPAWWVSHVERDLHEPAFGHFFEQLARRFTVVRYDRPGVGLSDRERATFTLDDEVSTLEAVLDGLGAPRVSLLAVSCGAPPALMLAARRPERLERLVVFGGYACGSSIAAPEVRAALEALVQASWGLGAKALSDIFTPDASAEEARRFAFEQRHSATPDIAARLLRLTFEMDVREVLERVQTPTLVLHRRQDVAVPFAHGRDVAARVPGAMLVPLEGRSHLPWHGDPLPALEALGSFLGQALNGASPVPVASNEFRRIGEVWTIVFSGRTVHLKHSRGLSDLATLLAHPGQRFHATELMGGPQDAPPPRLGADPTLDERARLEFRRRLERIDEQLEVARAASRDERAVVLEGEREAILGELRAATGLGGRRRSLGDSSERARKAVTSRIRESIARLHQVHPEMARHLDVSVETGTHCVYTGTSGAWRT
jgi:pimeloyl-ACP methyl ester carboxylesterase